MHWNKLLRTIIRYIYTLYLCEMFCKGLIKAHVVYRIIVWNIDIEWGKSHQ